MSEPAVKTSSKRRTRKPNQRTGSSEEEKVSKDRSDEAGQARSRKTEEPKLRATVKPKGFVVGSSWHDYMSYFDNVSQANEWTDADRARALPTCLQGENLDFYNALPEEIKGDFKLLTTTLGAKIDLPAATRRLKQDAFFGRQQKEGESVHAFSVAIGLLFDEAFQGASTFEKNELLKIRFLKGLLDKNIRLKVALSRPPTYEKAIIRALEIEAKMALSGLGTGTQYRDTDGFGPPIWSGDELLRLVKEQSDIIQCLVKALVTTFAPQHLKKKFQVENGEDNDTDEKNAGDDNKSSDVKNAVLKNVDNNSADIKHAGIKNGVVKNTDVQTADNQTVGIKNADIKNRIIKNADSKCDVDKNESKREDAELKLRQPSVCWQCNCKGHPNGARHEHAPKSKPAN